MPHRILINPALYGLLLVLCFFSALAQAAPTFPELTGRVVDAAGVLSPVTEQALDSQLAQHEKDTSNQLVVVTLEDLQGYDIADYGYQLGRHWGIGQQGRDNGALLIVAPGERKVRIEVGYGLEGVLTDATASNIIRTRILPRFRSGDYDAGVRAGVDAILAAIAGTYEPLPEKRGSGNARGGDFMTLVIMAIAFGQFLVRGIPSRLAATGVLSAGTGLLVGLLMTSAVFGVLAAVLVGLFHFFVGGGGGGGPWAGTRGGYYGGSHRGTWGGGFGGGGFGGGGFSGGGGGFGGGGASGGW
jgi:uncharacterized protein